MEITSPQSFISYFESIRKRTLRVINEIPPEKVNWRPTEDSFSFADLIRHIAKIEREMYGSTFQGLESSYSGHESPELETLDELVNYLDSCQHQVIDIVKNLTIEDMDKKCTTPAGVEISISSWMRTLIEHEVHHRGQIFSYLNQLGVETTPLYGLSSEEVKENSK